MRVDISINDIHIYTNVKLCVNYVFMCAHIGKIMRLIIVMISG